MAATRCARHVDDETDEWLDCKDCEGYLAALIDGDRSE